MANLNYFLNGFLECAKWSEGGILPDGWEVETLEDFSYSTEALEYALSVCSEFLEHNKALLKEYAERRGDTQYHPYELAGHDFWLTLRGHGAGFWDRGLGELGDVLTEKAEAYSLEIYVGDDSLLHFS